MKNDNLSCPMIPENEIINGERFQSIADVYITTESIIRFHKSRPSNPYIVYQKGEEFPSESINSLNNAKIIFVYSELIDDFFNYILPKLSNNFILISHNGDRNISEIDCRRAEDPRINHWFAQNLTIKHSKITAIPIGIANSHWPHGNISTLITVANSAKRNKIGIYVNFKVQTHPHVRKPLLEKLVKLPNVFIDKRENILLNLAKRYLRLNRSISDNQARGRSFERYLREMSKWRYCISPPGNGVDCHRTWEALYLGVYPILSLAPIDLLDSLPAIFFSSTDQLTNNWLENEVQKINAKSLNYEKLYFSWWRDKIFSMQK